MSSPCRNIWRARFGPGVRLAFALLTIFANITIFMAAVMYAGGLALSGFFGWPLLACIIGTGLFAGGWAVYGGLNTVAWTGVLTAIVKIGGVTLLTVLALKAMTPSGGVIDGFVTVMQQQYRRSAASGNRRLTASAPHLTHYGAYNRLTVFQPPDHPLTPWTGTFFGFLAVGVWYGVMNQFIVQRVLGARDIWHARMGMVMAGYAKLFLPLIIVLPGLILFARHPEFMLGDWADANHRADGGFVVLVREFFPAGLRGLLLAVLICAVQSTVSSVVNATAAILTFDIYVPLINPEASEKQKVRFGIWASHGRHRCRHRHGHRHQPDGCRHLPVYADRQCPGGAALCRHPVGGPVVEAHQWRGRHRRDHRGFRRRSRPQGDRLSLGHAGLVLSLRQPGAGLPAGFGPGLRRWAPWPIPPAPPAPRPIP